MARRLVSYQVSLAVVIAVLTALTGGWIAWWNYRAGVRNVGVLADDVFDRVASQTVHGTDAFLAKVPPVAETLRGLAELDPPAGVPREVLARRFVAALRANPTFAWISYSDRDGGFVGAFRDGGRIGVNLSGATTERLEHTVAADGTWGPARAIAGHYDPRARPFYSLGAASRTGAWTEPYVFAGQNVPGITYALAHRRGEALLGVFTIDFDLARLAALTRELQFSAHGKVAIVTSRGTVLGHPTAAVVRPPATPAGEPALVQASDIDDPALRALATTGALAAATRRDLALGDATYLVRSVGLAGAAGSPTWRVLAYAPESDFTAGLRERVFSSLLISLIAVVLAVGVAWVLARRVSNPLMTLSAEMVRAGELRIDDDGPPRTSVFREIHYMNESLAKMKGGLRSFSRYVPRDLVRALVASGKDAVLAGETRELTVYFSDLANFTTLAESKTPDELVAFLGTYFGDMSQIIAAERGTVDKYLGDGIMAFWGAPAPLADHAARACAAALASQRRVAQLAAGGVPFAARIGIASGEVLVGNIGSPERMNYTVMGDTANLAARLESLNKQYGTALMINERTVELAGAAIVARPIDVVMVKGKARGVRVYELLAMATDADADARAIAADSTLALDAYLAQQFDAAIAAWDRVLTRRPGDPAATQMRQRAERYATAPPGEVWTGVTAALEK